MFLFTELVAKGSRANDETLILNIFTFFIFIYLYFYFLRWISCRSLNSGPVSFYLFFEFKVKRGGLQGSARLSLVRFCAGAKTKGMNQKEHFVQI